MKWIKDGIEFEGTVDEYKEMMGVSNIVNVKRVVTDTKVFIPRMRRHHKNIRWTKELDDTIIRLRKEGRNKGFIVRTIRLMTGIKNFSSVALGGHINKLSSLGVDTVCKPSAVLRGQKGGFMRYRVKELMRTYNYNYEKARGMALSEWIAKQHTGNLKIQEHIVYDLMKIDDEGKESLVNTYVLKKDAEDMRKECITSSEAINERAIYYIKEVRRQK